MSIKYKNVLASKTVQGILVGIIGLAYLLAYGVEPTPETHAAMVTTVAGLIHALFGARNTNGESLTLGPGGTK